MCFMMAVFNALMFPTSVLNINGSDFLYCKEIMRMGEFDWCQVVVDDIRDKVDRWRKNRDKATPLVQGCIAFIMLRERNGSCYANIGDGPGGQGNVLESGTSSAGFLYGKAAGVVKIHPAAKAKRNHTVKEKGVKHHDKHRSPPADDNTKRSKSKGQSASKTMEYRHIPYGFLHLQSLLRGLGDHISDGQQKIEFLSALELHDKDVDDAIIKINEAHKNIEEAQQKFASEIKHMFGDLVGYSLNTESQRDVRRKRRTERPLGVSSLNVKRKSQIPREVSPEHTDSGDDCPEVSLRKEYDIKEAATLTGEKVLLSACWGLPYIDVPKQVLVNDCRFFVMLFLEHYDGEHRKFDVPIIPEKGTQYRAELMYYLFFHKMNEAMGPSLELFELLAPGKTEHNVIEGTQQIIDSSDATKVGVASCDFEKDDVASRDE
ncbi:hypothetical protein GUJ93_ZPchr0002g26174 [Zizania palustris]|uniref:Uncharacterized protein n=1 Tax=Zizania palustris TaxID=103762 RepID=A0A8J5VCC4_ZIZPA|nr:hypothetical protein GUJ93_ZPchr0002g26174 [Zizania palustris]